MNPELGCVEAVGERDVPTVSSVSTLPRYLVNGKWLVRPLTGTGRYSSQTLMAMLDQVPSEELGLVVPRSATIPEWMKSISIRRSRFDGQLFEQIALPWIARNATLINMSGPAPLLAHRQIVVMHDATPFRFPDAFSRRFGRWYRFMYRWLALRSTHLCTVSEFSANELSKVLNVPIERFALAPPAASIDGVEARPPRAELPARFVLMVGTLARNKNLVPAVHAVASRGIPVVVVGAHGASRVFGTTTDLPSGHVHLLGRLEDAELAWLYDNAQALVFPSLYEGFGLPILEAQSRGLPVVAARSASIPEVCRDSVDYFDPSDEADIGEVVERVWTDPMRRKALARAGRLNSDRFDWDEAARAIVDVARA